MGKDKKSNEEDICLNKTSKFAVLDAPGVSQPKPEDETKTSNTTNKEGLQGRRANASTGARMDDSSPTLIGGGCFEVRSANPEWIKVREEVYSKISASRDDELAKKTPVEISVTMPDGNVISANKEGEKFMAWKTSPYDVAAVISQGLADAAVVARVTYESYVSDYDLS